MPYFDDYSKLYWSCNAILNAKAELKRIKGEFDASNKRLILLSLFLSCDMG